MPEVRVPMRRTAAAAHRIAPSRQPRIRYRQGQPADAATLHALIEAHTAEGHLLPRALADLEAHAHRFIVAVRRDRIVGCAELAPLSAEAAEVRSLVVDRSARSRGIGRALISALVHRAAANRHVRLCAFTHDAGYFVRMGFSIVPHVWVPEKIALDCQQCPLFRRCGQHAVLLTLPRAGQRRAPGPALARVP